MTKSTPITAVNLAKNPAGPFAPNRLSLLPLYAPSPMDELFCRSTAIVMTTAMAISKTNSGVVKINPLSKMNLRFYPKVDKFYLNLRR